LENKRVQGAFSQTAIPHLPIRTEKREWEEDRSGGRPAWVLAGSPGHGDGREMGQNEGGDEGVLLPSSPWAGVRCRVGSICGGGLQAAAVGDGTSGGGGEFGREREMAVEVRGAIEKQHRLFIGRKRQFGGDILPAT
jgi:hypothetical protein